MCEMLGISAKRRIRANDILREFYSHADRHPHGWGLATFNDAGAPDIEKEAVKATESEYLKKRLAEPIEESVLLAHIRLATVGHLEYRNSHPFAAADNCVKMAPEYAEGYLLRGLAAVQQGRKKQGLDDLQKAKELGKEQAQSLIDKYK